MMAMTNAQRQRRYIARLKEAKRRYDGDYVAFSTRQDALIAPHGKDLADLLRSLAARPDQCDKIAEKLESAEYKSKPAYLLWDDLGNVAAAAIMSADAGDEDLIISDGDVIDNVDAQERFAYRFNPDNKPHWK
jgi:hypothetical protein